ncbi:unnamed protein product [Rhizophagus irregularis]|nr:unnamed protein product [Rhizophagus irregularis]CAB5367185.1 unnamed protein product [Rhizophagus irregularis]
MEKTKILSGGLPKNRKLKDSSRMGFRRTEKGEPLLRFISGGLLNNGKELRFVNLGGFPKNRKKEPKFVSGGFPKNGKRRPRFVVFPRHEDW